jgi:protein-tyrosine phosphatase
LSNPRVLPRRQSQSGCITGPRTDDAVLLVKAALTTAASGLYSPPLRPPSPNAGCAVVADCSLVPRSHRSLLFLPEGTAVRDCEPFADIHCHLLPAVDDGAANWAEMLAMAQLAVSEGFRSIVCTPHQLAGFVHVPAETIRKKAAEATAFLSDQHVALSIRPGAEIRIGPETVERMAAGHTLSLGEHDRHVLIELPFELYLPCDDLLAELNARRIVPIMAHPERNHALRAAPRQVAELVRAGWLMQLTGGSITGAFGPEIQQFAEQLLTEGLVHFISTDAHGPRVRPPLMRAAFDRVCELTDWATATKLCSRHPQHVFDGGQITVSQAAPRKRVFGWWPMRRAA